MEITIIIISKIEFISLMENMGWNEILSLFSLVEDGLDEPDL